MPDDEAAEVRRWAEALGVDRAEIMRDALNRHLTVLSSEHDASAWEQVPLSAKERSLSEIADRGPGVPQRRRLLSAEVRERPYSGGVTTSSGRRGRRRPPQTAGAR